ncbi:MAG: DNA polymerase IV [Firmicutes bacterium]|nr:DNA polymerase IV [Bacillota bacterium]
MARAILLADMNSFYASVHQALDPTLREKPVIVAGDPAKRHGIVLAASYEAKAFGIKTGLTVGEARRACPHGIFIKPQHHLYTHFSSRILNIMRDFTPLVEPFSIDEAFMDVTGCRELFGAPEEIARRLQERIRDEVGVGCSIGVGPNKLLAKMAAGLRKPNGLTVLELKDVPERLWPLPVRELFGIGSRYEHHLARLSIRTIGDLAAFPRDSLKKRFGVVGETMWWCANGVDHSSVDPHSLDQAKSIGQQITLPRDYRGEEVEVVLLELADLVGQRVRAGGYLGKTVVLTLKDTSFKWLSRMHTLRRYTDLTNDIYRGSRELFARHWSRQSPVRMVGVALGNLVPHEGGEQLSLFEGSEQMRKADAAGDAVRRRFGERAIFRAVSLTTAGVRYVR